MQVHDLTLEEQIGQLLMVGFWGTTPSPAIIELIQRYHVGNVILFSRNIHDTQQVLELTQQLQEIAKEAGQHHPLLIAIDQENGIVQRLGEIATLFPGNMALGATGSEDIAYKVAEATGNELKALGINMNLAPVVDVNNNPANPIIGVRSFGEDPSLVARLGAAMVKGYKAASIVSCLKHFPGHGDTAIDSHLSLPVIPYTLQRLETLELVPFKSGIEAGAESVMIAHITFPKLVEQNTLPATLSPSIIQGLLRKHLDFKGVILSDCMEMGAISDRFGTERAVVMAVKAGIDLVLVSHKYKLQRASIVAIQAAIQSHELTTQEVQQAAERVVKLKARYLSWADLPGTTTPQALIDREEYSQLQHQSFELSTTLVRNDEALLPLKLKPDQNIVVLSPQRHTTTIVEDRDYFDDLLVEILQQYHPCVELLPVTPELLENECNMLLRRTRESDIFVLATVNAHRDEQQAQLVRSLVSSGRHIIVIAVQNPYDLQAFHQLSTYLCTYEYSRPALVAAVRVMFGEKQAKGHLPVYIPHL
ncbi:MAG TPA: beta-N-acetylhexosaminidase [Ktedonobacteraceae bacterium]|nr:beta-N-acetylhexosaminidase [Ktedonobacteraceae bacterium]